MLLTSLVATAGLVVQEMLAANVGTALRSSGARMEELREFFMSVGGGLLKTTHCGNSRGKQASKY